MIVRPYDRKPPPLAPIDASNPINAGLRCSLLLGDRGARAYDSSLFKNHGALTNFPSSPYVGGARGGHALKFDGSNDYISIPHNASVNISSAITISIWLNPVSFANFAMPICKGSINTAYQIFVNTSAGNALIWRLLIGGQQKDVSITAIPTATWTHVVATYDGSIMVLYKNGASAGSLVVSGAIDTNTNPLALGGAFTPNFHWNGTIDNARVYARALSGGEAIRLYREPYAGYSTPRRFVAFKAAAGGGGGGSVFAPYYYHEHIARAA